MKTEKERMLNAELYDPSDAELSEISMKAHLLSQQYSQVPYDQDKKRQEIIDELLPNKGKNVYLQGPVYFDYGIFTTIGDNFYANCNLTILDCNKVTIGNNVMFGPNISIMPPMHPFMYQQRNLRFRPDGSSYDYEYAKKVEIGDNCWLASNVTVIGGVKIGSGSIIGAGSVVTKDIPENCLAAGNPCRVIRKINESDRLDSDRFND